MARGVLAELGLSTLPYVDTGVTGLLVAVLMPFRTPGVTLVVFTFAFGLKVDTLGELSVPYSLLGDGDRVVDDGGGSRTEDVDGLLRV